MRWSFLLLLSIGLGQCNKDDLHPTVDALIFGSYYGRCASDCTKLYKLENQQLYAKEKVLYISDDWAFSTTPASQTDYDLAKNLLTKFPKQLFEEPDQIGIPNAHDQGGLVIAVPDGESWRVWYIDTVTDRLPAYLVPYIQDVRKVLDQLP